MRPWRQGATSDLAYELRGLAQNGHTDILACSGLPESARARSNLASEV